MLFLLERSDWSGSQHTWIGNIENVVWEIRGKQQTRTCKTTQQNHSAPLSTSLFAWSSLTTRHCPTNTVANHLLSQVPSCELNISSPCPETNITGHSHFTKRKTWGHLQQKLLILLTIVQMIKLCDKKNRVLPWPMPFTSM